MLISSLHNIDLVFTVELSAMKFRVRCLPNGTTHKVEVPELCDLKTLKEKISRTVGIPVPSVKISLNKISQLDGAGGLSISSLGLRGGDLIYLLDETSGTVQNHTSHPVSNPVSNTTSNTILDPIANPNSNTISNATPSPASSSISNRKACADAAERRMPRNSVISISASQVESNHGSTSGSTLSSVHSESSEIHSELNQTPDITSFKFNPVFPVSLQKTFVNEVSKINSPEDALLITVHAVMVETGLQVFNFKQDSSPETYQFPYDWNLKKGPFTLSYCLSQSKDDKLEKVSTCKVTFQKISSSLVVYGLCSSDTSIPESQTFRVHLPFSQFCNVTFISNKTTSLSPEDIRSTYIDLNKLWKDVKDSISLPLFTFLCHESGLALPPSLPLLPSEIKLNIIERLPATSVVSLSCVCKEFQFLSNYNSIWKVLYEREFGLISSSHENCKKAFVTAWIQRKKRRLRYRSLPLPRVMPVPFFPPNPFVPPGIIGGDYDRFPAIGDSNRFNAWPTQQPRFWTAEMPPRHFWNQANNYEDNFPGNEMHNFENMQNSESRALGAANLNNLNSNLPLQGNRSLVNDPFTGHDFI